MAPCTHRYRDRSDGCPRQATAGSDCCIWHNRRISKSDAYVADLLQAELPPEGADLEDCHLAGLQWPGATLRKAKLGGADLRDAQLADADLRGADLRGTNLRRADLRRARLKGACLDGSDLTDCILSEADCQEASLRGVILDGTVLLGTDLRDAHLGGAQVRSFAWNRLSRFSGIRGLEAQGAGRQQGNDPHATQAYASPFALGEMDLSGPHRGAGLSGSDPELERTRIYRSGLLVPPPELSASRGSSPAGPALEPVATPLPQRQELARYRRAHRRLVAFSTVAVAVAVLTTALGLVSFLHRPQPSAPQTPVEPIAPLPPRQTPPPEQPSAAQIAKINQLLRDNEQLQTELGRQARQLEDERSSRKQERDALQDARRMAELETARLRAEADRSVSLARRLAAIEEVHEQTVTEARRLERMATIMAEGISQLREERDRLHEQVGRELVDRHRITTLQATTDRLEGELAETRIQLTRSREHAENLETDLRRSELAMQAVASRVKGTALETLLGTDNDEGPRLQLTPGRPLTLGGEHLITLRVEPGSQASTIRVRLVAQGSPGAALPDVSIVLYGTDGHALRKLSFAFPGAQGTAFAHAETEISCPQLPVAARILLSPALASSPEVAGGRDLDRGFPRPD